MAGKGGYLEEGLVRGGDLGHGVQDGATDTKDVAEEGVNLLFGKPGGEGRRVNPAHWHQRDSGERSSGSCRAARAEEWVLSRITNNSSHGPEFRFVRFEALLVLLERPGPWLRSDKRLMIPGGALRELRRGEGSSERAGTACALRPGHWDHRWRREGKSREASRIGDQACSGPCFGGTVFRRTRPSRPTGRGERRAPVLLDDVQARGHGPQQY